MLTGTFLSSRYCRCRLLKVLVGAVALDVSGLTTLVARGERARCEWVISWLVPVGAECTHRAAAAAAAPSPTCTPPSSPDSAPASSAGSSGRSVVPGLQAGGEGRSGVRSPAPACVRRGAERRSLTPSGLVNGAVSRGCGGDLLPCGN